MKILEFEHEPNRLISRMAPKLSVAEVQRAGGAEPNWDLEVGRLVDKNRTREARAQQSVNRHAPIEAAQVEAVATSAYPYDPDEVREIFEPLAECWEAETEFLSMTPQITGHQAYFEIVGLGPPAVPLILERLKHRTRFWFQALAAMTHENPAAEAETNSAAARAWLEWGIERGLVD